ncbi:MAG: NINE protein [Acidobacteriales bacterium]|nr:NINE protein [Terriglobales bacterium]
MSSVCPYCRAQISAEDDSRIFCNGCGTPHHKECYEENGGCTLFGCKHAPPDEPKLQVTPGEVLSAPGWPAPAFPTAQPTGFGDVRSGTAVAIAPRPQVAASTPPPPPPLPAVAAPSAQTAAPMEQFSTPGSILFAAPPAQGSSQPLPKSRIGFILLGIFLGSLGAHNFYAGYTKRALWQLAISVLTFFYGSIVSWIWAIVEVCTVDRDARNISFV